MIRPLSTTLTFIFVSTFSAFGQDEIPKEINQLLDKNICNTCHRLDERLIGPSYKELSKKGYDIKTTIELIANPNPENWPDYPPMAPMGHIDKKELKSIAKWLVELEN